MDGEFETVRDVNCECKRQGHTLSPSPYRLTYHNYSLIKVHKLRCLSLIFSHVVGLIRAQRAPVLHDARYLAKRGVRNVLTLALFVRDTFESSTLCFCIPDVNNEAFVAYKTYRERDLENYTSTLEDLRLLILRTYEITSKLRKIRDRATEREAKREDIFLICNKYHGVILNSFFTKSRARKEQRILITRRSRCREPDSLFPANAGVKQCKRSAKYEELAKFFLRHGGDDGREGRRAGGRWLFWRMINFHVITPQASY